MRTCIKCGEETHNGICEGCVEELLSKMSVEDRLAHSLVGLDVLDGKHALIGKLKNYKKLSYNELKVEFTKRSGIKL